MVGGVAAICGEASFLPSHLAGGRTEVCLWPGGKGKIPHADADAGNMTEGQAFCQSLILDIGSSFL